MKASIKKFTIPGTCITIRALLVSCEGFTIVRYKGRELMRLTHTIANN